MHRRTLKEHQSRQVEHLYTHIDNKKVNRINDYSPRKRPTKTKIKQLLKYATICSCSLLYLQLSVTFPLWRKDDTRTFTSKNIRDNLICSDRFDTRCTQLKWQGDALADLSKNDAFYVSIVISSCRKDIDEFIKYISNANDANTTIRSTTIISSEGCPAPDNPSVYSSRWKYPVMQFIEWITSLKDSKLKNLPTFYHQENSFIVFLNEKSIQQNNIRKLEILQLTLETGFGCVERPTENISYYHNGTILSNFTLERRLGWLRKILFAFVKKLNATKKIANFGEWLKHTGLSPLLGLDRELIPVCYGSSFSISSQEMLQKDLRSLRKILGTKTLEENIVQYVERTLAAIFSYQLPNKQVLKLMKYRTGVNNVTGSFTYDWTKSYLFQFFNGDTLEDTPRVNENVRLTLVISYCNESMSWMKEFFTYDLDNVVIYSKCGYPINYTFPDSKTIIMDNYGRCDHSYANWMAQMKAEEATKNHLVLFFKASRDSTYHLGQRYR